MINRSRQLKTGDCNNYCPRSPRQHTDEEINYSSEIYGFLHDTLAHAEKILKRFNNINCSYRYQRQIHK